MKFINTLKEESTLINSYNKTKCRFILGKLFESYFDNIFDYISTFTKNSEDAYYITQIVFTAAARNIDRLRHPIAFRFWIFNIANKKCFNFLNSNYDHYFEHEGQEVTFSKRVSLKRVLQKEMIRLLLNSLVLSDRKYVDLENYIKPSVHKLKINVSQDIPLEKWNNLRSRNFQESIQSVA